MLRIRRIIYMFSVLIVICGLWGCSFRGTVEERTLTMANYSNAKARYAGVQHAVEQFNAEHPNIHYTVVNNDYRDGIWDWDSYLESMEDSLLKGEQVDVMFIPSDYIGMFASKGYILPMDDVVGGERFQSEYFSPLIPAAQYDGHSWGFFVETDARMVYLNRTVLRNLGYSKEQMEQIPDRVRRGEVTLPELAALGKKAVEQDFSEYAIVHRPRNGLFFYMMARQFEAFSLDAEGNIAFDEDNFTRMLEFFRDNAQACKSPLPEEWREANDIFLQGRAAVYFGASWTIYDSIVEKNGDAQKLDDMYVVSLFPAMDAGDAPFTMSNAMLCGITSKCAHPEDVKEILANAYSDWDALAIHHSGDYRFPVSNSSAASPNFGRNTFLGDKLYMLDYTSYMPNLPDNQRWFQALHQAVRSVENGTGDPKDVSRTFAQDIEDEM